MAEGLAVYCDLFVSKRNKTGYLKPDSGIRGTCTDRKALKHFVMGSSYCSNDGLPRMKSSSRWWVVKRLLSRRAMLSEHSQY